MVNRLMRDLGDLAGLDIVAVSPRAPMRDAARRRPGFARRALRWLRLAAGTGGRCRVTAAEAGRPPARR